MIAALEELLFIYGTKCMPPKQFKLKYF